VERGSWSAEAAENLSEYPLYILLDGFVGEAEEVNTSLRQISLTCVVFGSLQIVYRAIDLDGDPPLNAIEVHDEAPDWMLAPELEARQALSA
jgi:hypothetical protein